MSTRRRALTVVLTAVVVLLITAATAFAAPQAAAGGGSGGASDAAHNIGEQLLEIAKDVIIPVAAIMALPALFKRDVSHALVILVLVVIVGAFAFEPGPLKEFVESIAHKILG